MEEQGPTDTSPERIKIPGRTLKPGAKGLCPRAHEGQRSHRDGKQETQAPPPPPLSAWRFQAPQRWRRPRRCPADAPSWEPRGLVEHAVARQRESCGGLPSLQPTLAVNACEKTMGKKESSLRRPAIRQTNNPQDGRKYLQLMLRTRA